MGALGGPRRSAHRSGDHAAMPGLLPNLRGHLPLPREKGEGLSNSSLRRAGPPPARPHDGSGYFGLGLYFGSKGGIEGSVRSVSR
jgi:hypothetical protein